MPPVCVEYRFGLTWLVVCCLLAGTDSELIFTRARPALTSAQLVTQWAKEELKSFLSQHLVTWIELSVHLDTGQLQTLSNGFAA